jgi:hypothetical protein
MITPSFSLTATERVLPRLALDFTTATLDSRVTFTRTGNTATVTNSNGVIVGINANLPRFDYDPTTLVCKGLLIEDARTNLLLNSSIAGINLSTQVVTTTAVAHTLSFYGTGQIALTGTTSSTVVGTGAYPTRTTLTFTPTVGALTLTVTGTVQYAQLEVGAFPTSYIPTDASQVTRTADIATMTGTNFSDWYNASEGTFLAQIGSGLNSTGTLVSADFSVTNRITFQLLSGNLAYFVRAAGATSALLSPAAYTQNTVAKIAGTYKVNDYAASANASTVLTDVAGALPTTPTQLSIGYYATNNGFLSGHVQKIMYWPQRLTNAEVQAFSK